MSLPEASAVLKRGLREAAVTELHNPAVDLAALARLAERCEQFSPMVGWQSMTPRVAKTLTADWGHEEPDHLFINITGVAHLFGGEEALAQRMVNAFRTWGLSIRLVLTESLGSAWALSETNDATTIIATGELEERLHDLPTWTLRLPSDTVAVLAHLGVKTIGQLRLISRQGLAERFGPLILLRLDQALSLAAEAIVPHRPAPNFAAEYQLEVVTERRDVIEWVLDQLLERLASALHLRALGAARLSVRLDCVDSEPVQFEVGLFRPTCLPSHMRKLLHLQCERHLWSGPVERIALSVSQTAALDDRQSEFFADEDQELNQPLTLLFETLSCRLGEKAVLRPVREPDAAPERAVRYEPLVGGQAAGVALRKQRATAVVSASSNSAVSDRPMRLLLKPERVDVMALAPDGPPASFHWQNQRYVVTRHWGPERIETGWWRGNTVRRDYYRVETDAELRYWLFRELRSQRWYLHGQYD